MKALHDFDGFVVITSNVPHWQRWLGRFLICLGLALLGVRARHFEEREEPCNG